jgi:hypothetical protein
MTYEITANTGRCEALTVSDIPVYRCTSAATADRDGHAVCAAHSGAHRICYYDSDDAGVLHGVTPRSRYYWPLEHEITKASK